MIGTRMRPWARLWIGLVFAAVLLGNGCAGGAVEVASKAKADEARAYGVHSARTRPLPDLGIPPTPTNLTPGRYATNEFEPSLSFRVGKGWAINNPEKTDHFSLYNRDFARSDKDPGSVLAFVDVRMVFDARRPAEGNVSSRPKNLVAWFQRHPGLHVSKPEPTTVGGVSAKRFEASVSSLPKERLDECPHCLPVFGLQYQEPVSIVKGFKQRITIVEGLRGETVAIILYAPPGQFDSYLPGAQGVLDSVEWDGAHGTSS